MTPFSNNFCFLTKPNILTNFNIVNQNIVQKQANEIFIAIKKLIESDLQRMDDNIVSLKNLNQLLKLQNYLKFKSQIKIIKQYHSQIQQNLESLLTQYKFQIHFYLNINCYKFKKEFFVMIQFYKLILRIIWRIIIKGNALLNLNQLKDAIECYNKVILQNPKNDLAYANKD